MEVATEVVMKVATDVARATGPQLEWFGNIDGQRNRRKRLRIGWMGVSATWRETPISNVASRLNALVDQRNEARPLVALRVISDIKKAGAQRAVALAQ